MKISMSKMLMCRLRSFVCRRSFSATPLSLPLPLDTATCRARALWAGRFRMKKESLGNQFNIFLFKTKTHVDSVQQKFRARMQLNAHVLLAQQFCQFSGKLCTMLDSIRSEDPAFTPYIHPLYGVVEILNCYYSDTSEVDEHLCTQWFGDQRYSKLFQQWQDLRKGVKQRAQSLEAFLSPDRPRLMADDGKVPLESLLELSIQCYLDWVPNRQPKQYDIDRIQECLPEAFPRLGTLIAAPTVIFLSSTAYGFHIGGNALHWKFDFQPSDDDDKIEVKDPFKLRGIYRDKRRSALKRIKGSHQVAQRYNQVHRAMQLCSEAGSPMKVVRLEELVLQAQESALYLGRQGQAMHTGSFVPRCSCGKCYYTYGFAEAPVEQRDTTIYPKLACAEDMWAWLVDTKKGRKF